MEAGGTIRSFIRNELFADPNEPLELDTPLLEGLLDSGDLMRVVMFLEERFDISVGDDELVAENFGSIQALERFVLSQKAHA